MGGHLRLYLFGPVRLEQDSQSTALRTRKAVALFVYLAVNSQRHRRDTLATLLWPESSQQRARASLRRTLYQLNQVLPADTISATKETIEINPDADLWIDVCVFRQRVAACLPPDGPVDAVKPACLAHLEEAAELYSDSFMRGFTLSDSIDFDDWQTMQRESLERDLAGVLAQLARSYAVQGQFDQAISYSRRWLALDPLHEPAQRELMRLYAWSGQRAAAVRQYEECERILQDEIGVYPEVETLELLASIKEGTVQAPPSPQHEPSRSRVASPAATGYILPPQPTPFIGREIELGEIDRLLCEPACRLLSLIGPGGIGKTRLAIQAAEHAGDRFAQGVYFVALQSAQSSDVLVTAIADALGIPLIRQDPPLVQVLDFVYDKELLLILDNFEQLLPEAGTTDVLSQMLQSAPAVTLLITSRTALNLQEEWLYSVSGLALPDSTQPDVHETSDAVQLFVERAGRMRRDFSPGEAYDAVVTICQLVEGMPLALELAASWVTSMSCRDIAVEIRDNLEFLATNLRNVPDRHRSVQVIFDQTWAFLTPDEREVFKRLSVFRGGFRREAAEQVAWPDEGRAGPFLHILSALVDKSLVRWDRAGQYQIHELLRQYAEEQLARSEDERVDTRNRHCNYYAGFLGDQLYQLTTQQRDALLATAAELDNIRVAWHWAVDHASIATIHRAAMPFFAFCQGQSRYREGVDALAAAYEALSNLPASEERNRTLAELLTGRGWLEMRLGRLTEAGEALETASEIYATSRLTPESVMGADPLAALPVLRAAQGDYAGAVACGERAWQATSERDDTPNLALAGYGLTSAAIAQGRYEEALRHANKTLALTETVGNRWFMAYVYNHLGEITQMLGDTDAARSYYQASYAIREEFDDPEGMAVALNHLGEIALRENQHALAAQLYQQSLAIYERIGDRGGLVQSLRGLGMAAHRLQKPALARKQLQRALEVAADTHLTPLLLSVMVDIGTFLIESDSREWGVAALTFVREHPAGDQMTKERVDHLLRTHDVELPMEAVPGSRDLKTLIISLQAELATPTVQSSLTPPISITDQPLIEPLTEREVEVLHQIAAGLKNREIAAKLTVAISTIKTHINNIYGKLGVDNRVQAISRARELELLD